MTSGYITAVDKDAFAQIIQIWAGAEDLEPTALEVILAAAKVQCETFERPGIAAENQFLAQIFQARALARAGYAGTDGEYYNGDGPTITMFPMDWTVKNLLRPKRPLGGLAESSYRLGFSYFFLNL